MNTGIRRVGIAMIVLFVGLVAQLTYLQVGRSSKLANAAGQPAQVLRRHPPRPRPDRDRRRRRSSRSRCRPTTSTSTSACTRPTTATLFADVVGYQSIQHGAVGVENAYSSELEGRTFELQLNNLADAFANKQPVGTVVLTMSKLAQGTAAFALQGKRGSVVVLDVQTGGVLAAYSNPTYDPNLLASHDAKKAQAAFSVLTNAPDNPLLARAWRELYPPGSTFKTVTASIALQNGVDVDKTFPVDRPPRAAADERRHRSFNFGRERCGGILLDGFIVSCNTTYAQVGLRPRREVRDGHPGLRRADRAAERGRLGDRPADRREHRARCRARSSRTSRSSCRTRSARTRCWSRRWRWRSSPKPSRTRASILQPHVVDCVLDPNDKVVSRVGVQQYKRAIDPATADTMTHVHARRS